MIKVAPSILSADFAEMGRAAENCESWGADYIHFDVMDGTFVPTITFGPQMCKAVRRHTKLPIDVHLMVEHPETYIPLFRDAGADIITFHIEADRHAHRTLQAIHNAGMKAGIVLNPSTSPEAVRYVISSCDMVLLMSVNPGAGGDGGIVQVILQAEIHTGNRAEDKAVQSHSKGYGRKSRYRDRRRDKSRYRQALHGGRCKRTGSRKQRVRRAEPERNGKKAARHRQIAVALTNLKRRSLAAFWSS